LESVRTARFADFKGLPGVAVESPDAFEEMKQHILQLYERVEGRHTFTTVPTEIVDCIPAEQQPGARHFRGPIPDLPPLPDVADAPRTTTQAPAMLGAKAQDSFGNEMLCPAGTIPIRRVTLDQLTRFPTLTDFVRKSTARNPATFTPSVISTFRTGGRAQT
jgi:hypothetical protein